MSYLAKKAKNSKKISWNIRTFTPNNKRLTIHDDLDLKIEGNKSNIVTILCHIYRRRCKIARTPVGKPEPRRQKSTPDDSC